MATAAIGLGAGLVSSLIGGILGNKPQTTTTDSTTNQTQTGEQNLYGTSANTHVYDEAGTNLKNYLLNLYAQQLLSAAPDARGITAQQLQSNNQNSSLSGMALNHLLAQRGLTSSPVGANAIIQNETQRAAGNS